MMPGNSGVAGAELANQVVADFVLDGAARDAAGRDVVPELAERGCVRETDGGHNCIVATGRLLRCWALSEFSQRGSGRPLVFAHRGGAGAPAREHDARRSTTDCRSAPTALELDVHLSRDGVVIVHHDAHARSHDRRPRPAGGAHRGRARPRRRGLTRFEGFRGAAGRHPDARGTCCGAIRRAADHRAQGRRSELAHRTIDDVRAAGRRRSRRARIVRHARPARGAPYEPRDPHRRRARGDALALYRSWVRWPLGGPQYRRVSGPRAVRLDARRHAALHARTPTAPASPFRSGPSTTPPTCCVCSTGAPTASSAIGPISRSRSFSRRHVP